MRTGLDWPSGSVGQAWAVARVEESGPGSGSLGSGRVVPIRSAGRPSVIASWSALGPRPET